MAVLRRACAIGTAGLVGLMGLTGCVPGELFLASRGEGGADVLPGPDGGGDSPANGDSSAPCPTPPDCSNPACRSHGYVCTPPARGGSTLAAVFAGGGSCPAGSGKGESVFSAPTGGPADCGCACMPATNPTCLAGNIVIAYGTGGSCTSGNLFIAGDGACQNASTSFTAYVEVKSVPGPTGGTCDGEATTSLPPDGAKSSLVCPASGALSTTGCSGGDVCLVRPSGASMCTVEKGAAPCAGAYSVSHTVGASVTDTRTCVGVCGCGAPTATCSDPKWVFYMAPGCTGPSVSVDTDGACDATGSPPGTFSSYDYTASPTGIACGKPMAVPKAEGELSLVAPQTLCCLP